ncbi:hypothetical protein HPB49_002940 [Dermacentor silvarum]|uniref:Uncharacterized protein n=1 Tax=Dermacentor silvarum TaxID=543639 RepID=A0ACB8CUU5_DERSI|nr:hypothetical protein HPB49_002940 [Dermacentor silvarum]
MGKKCFVPRCKSGYNTCTEKVSLFAAPGEAERLKIWRHAIPRKDRVLQSTDYVLEKHFEPRYLTKTWEAVYKGHVLVSAPRKTALAKDAVPTQFPDCPAHLTKVEKTIDIVLDNYDRSFLCQEHKVDIMAQVLQ